MKYTLSFLLLLLVAGVSAQVDTTRELPKRSVKFADKVLQADSAIIFPRDTFKLKSTWSGISFKNNAPYFWNGMQWSAFGVGAGSGWDTAGNAGTTASSFIGTTDSADFVAKTNNAERVRIKAAGNVGIGTSSPLAKLHVSGGDIYINGNYPSNASSMRLVSDPLLNQRAKIESGNTGIGGTGGEEGVIYFAAGNNAVFEIDGGENNDVYIHAEGAAKLYGNGVTSGIFGFDVQSDSTRIRTPNGNVVVDSLVHGSGTIGVRWDRPTKRLVLGENTVATSVPLSGITAATETNTINSGNFGQTWQWNNLTTGNALMLSSTSTGATGNDNTVLYVGQGGTNSNASQSTYAAQIVTNKEGGASGTSVALVATANSGTNKNIAAQFSAISGTNNYAIIVPPASGSVGIGTSAPNKPFSVYNKFGVNSDGDFTAADSLIVGWNDGGSASLEVYESLGGNGLVLRGASLGYLKNSAPASSQSLVFKSYTGGGSFTVNMPDSAGTLALTKYTIDSLRRVGVNVQARKDGVWTTQYTDSVGGGGSTSPAGNYGNVQLNRNGAFATPGSDSLSFSSGQLLVKGSVSISDGSYLKIGGVNIVHYNTGSNNATFNGAYNFLFQNGGNVFMNTANSTYFSTSTGDLYFSGSGKLGIGTASPNSALHTKSMATALTSKSVDYTAGADDHTIVVTVTGKTITLPTAASITGRVYTVKLTASGTGTVATTSSQTIDGSTTYSLSAQYKYVTVQSDGSNWIIIANN